MKHFKRFNDIDSDYLLTDKHIHTNWTDGENSVAEMASEAQKIGLLSIAFTDHIRSDSVYFDECFREIREADSEYGIEILSGLEARISDFEGNLDVADDVFEKVVVRIASVHRFPVDGKLYDPAFFDKDKCQEIELELSLAAVKKGSFNVLGHPGGMSLRTYGEFPVDFFKEMIKSCTENGIAFELNSSYHLPVYGKLKSMLSKYDPYVSLGSDAHSREVLGSCVQWLKGENVSV